MLAFQTGINLLHVPYKGVGPATTAVLGGDVLLMYNSPLTPDPSPGGEGHEQREMAVNHFPNAQ